MSAVLFDAEKLAIAVHRQNNYYKFHILTQTATAKIMYVRNTCRGGCKILVWKGHWQSSEGRKSHSGVQGQSPNGVWGRSPQKPEECCVMRLIKTTLWREKTSPYIV